jgi:hypothetical protein
VKTKYLTILLLIFMVLSCKAQKKNNSGGQDKNVEENIETSKLYFNNDEQKIEYIAKALQDWTLAKYLEDDNIINIIYENGRFLSAGGEKVAYSDDGDTWHRAYADGDYFSHVRSMAFGKGRFVVTCGYGTRIAYSNDCKLWKLVKNDDPSYSEIHYIVYGNDYFLAVGNDKYNNGDCIIGYSNDGEKWTPLEYVSLNINVQCLTYGNGMFIAGGHNGDFAYSSDGKTWETGAFFGSQIDHLIVWNIAFGNGRFIAYCSYIGGDKSTTFFSDNGIDWIIASNPPVYPVSSIVYGNGIFISGSRNARISFSVDGDIWYPLSNGNGFTIEALAGNGESIRGIAYGNGRFVMGIGSGIPNSCKIAWCDIPEIPNATH